MFSASLVMASFWLAMCLLFSIFIGTFCLDVSQIQVPKNDGISGVHLIQTKNNQYNFNATIAGEVCKAIQMRIATKAEVEAANKNGLQTCRFGWIEEQVAVISRTESNEKCGKGSLGVMTWRTSISKLFDVYCFKSEGPDAQFETTTSSRLEPSTERERTPSIIHSSAKTSHPSHVQSTARPVRSLPPYASTTSISSALNTSSTTYITVSLSSPSASLQPTTSPQSLSSPRTLTKFTTVSPLSSSRSSSPPSLRYTSASTDQPTLSQTTRPDTASIKAVPKALAIISAVLLLFMAVAGSAWYCRIKRGQRFPSWTRMRQKETMETEMWKQISDRHCIPEQTDSEDNNNRKCNNIVLQMEQDPDSDSVLSE